MTEECLTLFLCGLLRRTGWTIVCVDFPQSGTGVMLHSNALLSKNEDAIVPDIVAVRDGTGILFENKVRFCRKDFEKIQRLRTTDSYAEALGNLLRQHDVGSMLYGVGLALAGNRRQALECAHMTDFTILSDGCDVDFLKGAEFGIFAPPQETHR